MVWAEAMTNPSTAPVLAAERLAFGYGHDIFLRINKLEVKPGELVGLVGPNGAGKSTLLRLLAGLATPREGVVYICGQPVDKLSPVNRARLLAWVPQRSETPFESTVGEMVAAGRYPYLGARLGERTVDRVAVAAAIRRVGLEGLAGRPLGTLSGGEWQRALIARALAQQARVLLLDEPVGSLDLGYQRQVYELVRELADREGIAVLAADHHIDLQALFCDRLLLLAGGTLVASGRVDEVLREDLLERSFGTPLRVARDESTGAPLVRWRIGRSPVAGRPETDQERP